MINKNREKKIVVPEFLRAGQFIVSFYEWTLSKRGEDIFHITNKQFDKLYREFLTELK